MWLKMKIWKLNIFLDYLSMILNYWKTYVEIFERRIKTKKVVIGVPTNFNSLQR